jgi:hypothetical protein
MTEYTQVGVCSLPLTDFVRGAAFFDVDSVGSCRAHCLRGAGSTHSPLDVSARVLQAGRRADFASLASFDLARSIREVIEPTHL